MCGGSNLSISSPTVMTSFKFHYILGQFYMGQIVFYVSEDINYTYCKLSVMLIVLSSRLSYFFFYWGAAKHWRSSNDWWLLMCCHLCSWSDWYVPLMGRGGMNSCDLCTEQLSFRIDRLGLCPWCNIVAFSAIPFLWPQVLIVQLPPSHLSLTSLWLLSGLRRWDTQILTSLVLPSD